MIAANIVLAPGLPEVCRLGLATRGNTHLDDAGVEMAIGRGMNYLNWCGRPDALSRTIARMGALRKNVVVAAQFEPGSTIEEFLDELKTDWIDVLTLYYIESEQEWEQIIAPGGAWHYLNEQKQQGRLKMIGLTTHQRHLAAKWAATGMLDLLMIRFNAAHRGARENVLPNARIPVVGFTGLRWGALLRRTPDDPSGFQPPSAAECYRFSLMEPGIFVSLAAPGNHRELQETLAILADWSEIPAGRYTAIAAHGDRVRKYGGAFP